MLARWPFFAGLVGDVEVSLAKADLTIAEHYSRLSPLHDEFFPIIKDEDDRSVSLVPDLRGGDALLSDPDTLKRSIRLRNPSVAPISLLQVDLLDRWRRGGRQDDAILRALMVSVNGIAHGMQNTG